MDDAFPVNTPPCHSWLFSTVAPIPIVNSPQHNPTLSSLISPYSTFALVRFSHCSVRPCGKIDQATGMHKSRHELMESKIGPVHGEGDSGLRVERKS
jgi:hypothetical protein